MASLTELSKKVLLKKLILIQLVEKFPAFYEVQIFIIAVTQSATFLCQINQVHAPQSISDPL